MNIFPKELFQLIREFAPPEEALEDLEAALEFARTQAGPNARFDAEILYRPPKCPIFLSTLQFFEESSIDEILEQTSARGRLHSYKIIVVLSADKSQNYRARIWFYRFGRVELKYRTIE